MTLSFVDTSPRAASASAQESSTPWLSIVLPAHNEAPHIGRVAVGFLRAAERLGRGVEVLVVDDGSTDGTAEALRRHEGGDDARIRLIRRERCGGYGSALTRGFHHARGEWVFFSDADGQFSADELPAFLATTLDAEPADARRMVIGYRAPRRDNVPRLMLGRAWTSVVNFALRVETRDVNCAYKAMRKVDLEAMHLESSGAMINAELLHKARRLGIRVVERPVGHYPRASGEQSGANPGVMLKALYELTRYRVESWQRRATRGIF